MKDIAAALATRLQGNTLGHTIVWQNFEAPATYPRFEVKLGPSTASTRSYSGMAQTDQLIQIDCVVAAGSGLNDLMNMQAEVIRLFPAGLALAGGTILTRPTSAAPISDKTSLRLPMTLQVRMHA